MATHTENSTNILAPRVAQAVRTEPAGIGHLLLPAGTRLPPAQRLIVLVPATWTNETALAQHIWTLAQPRGLPVMYVGRATEAKDEAGLRRRLALLAALTRDNDHVTASTRFYAGDDWLALLHRLVGPGDLVVAHTEQSAPLFALGKPFAQVLTHALRTPVYVIGGFCAPEADQWVRLRRNLLFWAGALALAAAFFWLQLDVVRLSHDWLQTLVLMVTVVAEFGLLLVWHRWLQ